MSLEDTIETTLNQIQKVMGANSIVGTEIITDDKVIIPISKVALGFGVGVYDNQKDSETNVGGAGGGGSIDPVAFLIVSKGIGTTLDDILTGAGQVLFDIISNASSSANKSSKSKTSTVDSIKTKVRKE